LQIHHVIKAHEYRILMVHTQRVACLIEKTALLRDKEAGTCKEERKLQC
jgi:hypothetical protein